MKNWVMYGIMIGLPVGAILTIITVNDTFPLTQISVLLLSACSVALSCVGDVCFKCTYMTPLIAFTGSFVIGAILGPIVEKANIMTENHEFPRIIPKRTVDAIKRHKALS